jgi:hypothetical protein
VYEFVKEPLVLSLSKSYRDTDGACVYIALSFRFRGIDNIDLLDFESETTNLNGFW